MNLVGVMVDAAEAADKEKAEEKAMNKLPFAPYLFAYQSPAVPGERFYLGSRSEKDAESRIQHTICDGAAIYKLIRVAKVNVEWGGTEKEP